MPKRTPEQSLAALRKFRAAQSEVDGPIDEDSGLLVEDLDAAIAALEQLGGYVARPRLKMRFE